MYDVVCIGILCADVLAKPVDKLPERGRLGLVGDLVLRIGGCAANAAIDLCRIGVNTAIVGKIGKDGFGQFIKDALVGEGAVIRGLKEDPGVSTSASVVAIGSDGERSIIHCLGSNAKFGFKDIDLEMVKAAKILFIAGTFLMPSFDGEGTEKLLAAAKDAGVICCMDTAWDSSGKWMDKIGSSLAYLDWFMPSFEEAAMLSGADTPEDMAESFLQKGAANVVIKLGSMGCYVRPGREDGFYVPAFRDVPVADTSGAGDAFCAGFITGLSKGWDIMKCAVFANATGGQCVMEIGTTAGIKKMDEVLEFIKARQKY